MGYDSQDGRPVVLDLETAPAHGAEALFTEPVQAPATYKDADKIAAYIENAQAKQRARAALDPWTARIVALGIWAPGLPAPRVRVARSEAEEAEALAAFWALVGSPAGSVAPLVTFNGRAFDLPVLMVRSRLLDVHAPILNIDRYRSPHPDLLDILTFRGAIASHKLTWFARRFGLSVTDETTGADIGALVAAEDWSAVEAHCASDVALTARLAARLGLLSWLPADAPAQAVA